MGGKPANLIYGLDDKPPLGTILLLSLQHIFIISVYFIFPVIIVNQSGGTAEQAATMITMSMLVIGLTTILQAIRKGPFGSGYLCPSGNGPAYLSAGLLAAKTGGLPLVAGMTVFGGFVELFYAPLITRLRPLFPPEVAGLVVAVVGIELVPLGVQRIFNIKHLTGGGISITHLWVGLSTYVVMVGFNIWSKGKLRLYPILIGMLTGYLLAYQAGLLTAVDLSKITASPLLALPAICSFGWSFDYTLLLPFTIATLCSSLKDVGDLTTCQKINDTEWKRPDMQTISGGIMADAVGDILSGIIGGLGQSTSSSNVGLSIATGATSRYIAYGTGALLWLLAFCPKLAELFVIMPTPVMGAILLFCANFMIVSGLQILTTRMLDTRKIFVVGTSLCFGLSVYFFPRAYADLPLMVQPIFSSALSLTTVMAVILNIIFRIGISKRQELILEPVMESIRQVPDFMFTQGAVWGARGEVIHQATAAMSEFMECLLGLDYATGAIRVTADFDEFNLDVSFVYEGRLLDFDASPDFGVEDLLADGTAVFRLSRHIIAAQVDRIKTDQKDGTCRVLFHFDH